MRKTLLAALAASTAFTVVTPAVAQATDPNQALAPDTRPPLPGNEDDEAEEEAAQDDRKIVVTGTSIRGVAPPGANVIGVDRTDIETSGATDSNRLLGTLPQSNFFLADPQPGGGDSRGVARIPIVRPNLRNLGGPLSTGSTTLVLIDGHRVVPSGIEQSQVDAGVVPPGILDRVEVILDGVSAVYGSDAVGGVINYITRKRFNETKADVQYSVGDDYFAIGGNASTGVTWPTGGIGVTYSFGKNNTPLRRDRDYAIPRNALQGDRLTGLACETYAHVVVGAGAAAQTFVVDAGTPNSASVGPRFCIDQEFSGITPEQVRHSGFLTFSQDVSDTIKFDATAFYTHRTTTQIFGPFTTAATIRPTNPYFRLMPTAAPQATQSVNFSFGPIFGLDENHIDTTTELWQVTPQLSVELGDWEVRGLFAYGKSKASVIQRTLDPTSLAAAVNGTTFATALNPYDIAATQNQAIFATWLYDSERTGKHDYMQGRLVADGPLFTLPGGELRVAAGVEWNKTTFHRNRTDATTRIVLPFESASTESKAAFGEFIAPIFSDLNAIPGFAELTLSASARWDDYEFYGDTINPKVALTWRPVDWVTLRGNWSTAFRAPNAVDRLGSSANSLTCQGVTLSGCGPTPPETLPTNLVPVLPAPVGQFTYLFLSGTRDDLVPETSENWAVGADIRPPFIPGLSVSGTYYSIVFENQINSPTGLSNNAINFLNNAPHLVVLPDPATGIVPNSVVEAIAAGTFNGAQTLAIVRAAGLPIHYVLDGRVQNLGSVKVAGVDGSARYTRETSFGSIQASINGTWRLKSETRFFANSNPVDGLAAGTSKFAMTAQLGAAIGNFFTQFTLQHSAGFNVNPAANRLPSQTKIPAYDVVNWALRWNIENPGLMLNNLVLSLNITNLFDTPPPRNLTTTGTTINGFTLGRVVQGGISMEF